MYIKPVEALHNEQTIASLVLEQPPTDVAGTFEKIDGSGSISLSRAYESSSTTITAVDSEDPTVITVSSAAWILAGEAIFHRPQQSVSTEQNVATTLYIYSSNQSTNVLVMESPPATPFAVGDVIDSLNARVTIPASATTVLGTDYRIRWSITHDDSTKAVFDQPVYVCKTIFSDAPTLQDAARYISVKYPSASTTFKGERLRYVVGRAQQMVRNALLETGKYAHLAGNSGTFYEAGLIALKIALIDENLYERGTDLVSYTDQMRKQFFGSIAQANKTLQYYDEDSSGTIESSEYAISGSIPVRRY